jgi:hypothetical protein
MEEEVKALTIIGVRVFWDDLFKDGQPIEGFRLDPMIHIDPNDRPSFDNRFKDDLVFNGYPVHVVHNANDCKNPVVYIACVRLIEPRSNRKSRDMSCTGLSLERLIAKRGLMKDNLEPLGLFRSFDVHCVIAYTD